MTKRNEKSDDDKNIFGKREFENWKSRYAAESEFLLGLTIMTLLVLSTGAMTLVLHERWCPQLCLGLSG